MTTDAPEQLRIPRSSHCILSTRVQLFNIHNNKPCNLAPLKSGHMSLSQSRRTTGDHIHGTTRAWAKKSVLSINSPE